MFQGLNRVCRYCGFTEGKHSADSDACPKHVILKNGKRCILSCQFVKKRKFKEEKK